MRGDLPPDEGQPQVSDPPVNGFDMVGVPSAHAKATTSRESAQDGLRQACWVPCIRQRVGATSDHALTSQPGQGLTLHGLLLPAASAYPADPRLPWMDTPSGTPATTSMAAHRTLSPGIGFCDRSGDRPLAPTASAAGSRARWHHRPLAACTDTGARKWRPGLSTGQPSAACRTSSPARPAAGSFGPDHLAQGSARGRLTPTT